MTHAEAVGAAWPAFMRYLATLPTPDGVVAALAEGPLASYRAEAVGLHLRDRDHLVSIAQYGYSEEAVARAATVDLTLDMPITVACRHNELVIRSLREAIPEFAGMSLDPDIWGNLTRAKDDAGFVVAPIACEGRVVGTLNFTFSGEPDFDAQDLSYFTAIGALLGLWLTHPGTRVATAAREHGHPANPPLSLSDRQVRILQLAATGRSNPAIAANLGYSVSTVKQEMSRILDVLRVANRADAIQRARQLDLIGGDGEVARTGR